MPIALYARTSTTGQRLDGQLDALRGYAARTGAEAHEFTDQVSGAKAARPGLDALLTACRRREVGAVVVTKLDRVGRSVRHLTELAAELEALGVALVVLDQAIDTRTPTGRLVFNVLASIAEFERELIRERVLDGLATARRKGKRLGQQPAFDRAGLARVRRLRASGHSIRAIARIVGRSHGAVHRALQAS